MKHLITALLLLSFKFLCAQQTGRMETDRPDQTESPFVTKKGFLQTEWGFNVENDNDVTTLVHPTTLWKYGLSTKMEFRLITEFISMQTPLLIPQGNSFETGMLPVQIGGKIYISEEKGVLPKTSLIFHIAAPKIASKKFRANKWAPNFRFTMQNSLSENIGLGYNLGAEWHGETTTPAWIYTFAPGFNIGKKWYGYVEAFGEVKKNEKPAHALDIGLAYYFSDNAKIDFSGGVGISKAAINNYFAIGFSHRFQIKK